mmetsp:Transcript_46020/g.115862  ORF Transcript_46020/g.115862 Transcript_46020/m.115862 type:complete len:159 (-) Transcript_46020:107-583(-)
MYMGARGQVYPHYPPGAQVIPLQPQQQVMYPPPQYIPQHAPVVFSGGQQYPFQQPAMYAQPPPVRSYVYSPPMSGPKSHQPPPPGGAVMYPNSPPGSVPPHSPHLPPEFSPYGGHRHFSPQPQGYEGDIPPPPGHVPPGEEAFAMPPAASPHDPPPQH